jgi:hypothetical protein
MFPFASMGDTSTVTDEPLWWPPGKIVGRYLPPFLAGHGGFEITGEDDLVFVDDLGGHLDDWQLRRRFHDALDRAGLKRLRLHDLRHTFGTLAVQAFPLSDVRAFMGHADIETTMIYVHHVPQADAAERLSRLVAAVESVPRLHPVSGHIRDTNADPGEPDGAKKRSGAAVLVMPPARIELAHAV